MLRDDTTEYKVVVVGNSDVGKTCLGQCLMNEPFDGKSSPTVTPSFTAIPIRRSDGSTANILLWDTSGQERYNSISQLFFRNAKAAVVCFDVTNMESAESIDRWIELVKDEAGDVDIFIAGLKGDLLDPGKLAEVSAIANEFSKKAGGNGGFITSSKAGFGVEELFKSVADACGNVREAEESVEFSAATPKKQSCCT